MIENTQRQAKKPRFSVNGSACAEIERLVGRTALRWYIGQVTKDEVVIETTAFKEQASAGSEPFSRQHYPGKDVVLNIVPTGIGCSIGGFAGDASPVTRVLATAADYLLTHPNTVNASDFIGLPEGNVVYADGYSIDAFCKGAVDLHLPHANRVGVIVEKSDDWKLNVIFNVINAVRAVHGVNITDCVVTEEPIGGRCIKNDSGAFVGTIDNPRVIFEACERLLDRGVDAIALTSNIQDLPLSEYARHFQGEFPNPVGGVEAVISYLVTSRYHVPSAHAPLINTREFDLTSGIVDARGAGEYVSTSGLACVLIGLRRAPQTAPRSGCRTFDIINVNNLAAVVCPASSLGGIPVLYAHEQGVPIIAVQENRTILDVTQESLGLENVIQARSYAEAAGLLHALKRGVSLQSLTRPLRTYRY
jgi:Protein of unknown function (DUF3326)